MRHEKTNDRFSLLISFREVFAIPGIAYFFFFLFPLATVDKYYTLLPHHRSKLESIAANPQPFLVHSLTITARILWIANRHLPKKQRVCNVVEVELAALLSGDVLDTTTTVISGWYSTKELLFTFGSR